MKLIFKKALIINMLLIDCFKVFDFYKTYEKKLIKII